ncbi:hypothetical protein D6833_05720 [Candidatus Parcubacteria bacterium]|nr:MAG: hypothetical protein D6833_05720 [Candidatus Parcubacteria bacterium]
MRQVCGITEIDVAFCEVLGCVPRPRGTKVYSERWMVEVPPPRSRKEQIDHFYYWNEVIGALVQHEIFSLYEMEFFVEEFGAPRRRGWWQWLKLGFPDPVREAEQFGAGSTAKARGLQLYCGKNYWEGDVVYFTLDFPRWRALRAVLAEPVSGICVAPTPAHPFGVRVDRICRVQILEGRNG